MGSSRALVLLQYLLCVFVSKLCKTWTTDSGSRYMKWKLARSETLSEQSNPQNI